MINTRHEDRAKGLVKVRVKDGAKVKRGFKIELRLGVGLRVELRLRVGLRAGLRLGLRLN